MAEIVMPRLSDSMEEGTILTWMKQVGDEVAVGDELVEIETDKANMAYESRRRRDADRDPRAGGRDAADRGADRGGGGRGCEGRQGIDRCGRGSCRCRGPTIASGS